MKNKEENYWSSNTTLAQFNFEIVVLLWIGLTLLIQDWKIILPLYVASKIIDYIFWRKNIV